MAGPTTSNPLELDGRTLEGGGQLIRIALCLSALTSTPTRITNVRGNRSGGGGLKAQHIACVEWLAKARNATVHGATKGSQTLLFQPGGYEGDLSPVFTKRTLDDGRQVYECRVDMTSAGSTALVLQAILPFILFSRLPSPLPIHLHLSGGTNSSGSPSFEYIAHLLLPTLHRIGFPEMKATLGQRGWSQGATSIGNWTLEIPPRSPFVLPTFTYRPANPSATTPLPSHLHAIFLGPAACHEQVSALLLPQINNHFYTSSSNFTLTLHDSHHPKRIYFILIATIPTSSSSSSYILARDHLQLRKFPTASIILSEIIPRVIAELASDWRSGAWVDEHMRDQLVIFQALAEGRCEVFPGREENGGLREPSLHARTAEWVARSMLGVRFDAEGVCGGVGFGGEDGPVERLEKLEVG
ncbi:rna 3 -terminal phosphate cyclase like protein [Zymoseptoria brevis]|uniref:Rna 3-terminal phosphate cyclase like protein n=1 Tax=Zymoseptoria brevis TaxID=1047168 RepID=A0A0F4GWR1_9PEZI|nr:rna 3 -terminal phosphate cyclase like protein [Zymoseptoria brevis]